MKRLKRRESPNTLRSEVRLRGGRIGRYLYGAVLLAIVLWIADAFVGHLIYFRAQGLVVADVADLGTEYGGRIADLPVERGTLVKKGEIIVRLTSQEVFHQIAEISADIALSHADLIRVEADFLDRDRLRTQSERRLAAAERLRDSYQTAKTKHLVTDRALLQVENEYYEALRESRRLKSAFEGLRAEAKALRVLINAAEEALGGLRTLFDNGAVRAPWDGLVTDVPVLTGSVVLQGTSLGRVANERRYVLAYRSTGTLYSVAVGEEVTLSDGVQYYRGRIADLLPLTAKLPDEFQRVFRPAAREQVLRIEFEDSAKLPPLYATVEVTRHGWWGITRLRTQLGWN